MSEVFIQFATEIAAEGKRYVPRAVGEPVGGTWHGWIEFIGSDGSVVTTDRETTQPNRGDLAYWATGLSDEYLEGALDRALHPPRPRVPADIPPPKARPPRSAPRGAPVDLDVPVLDPFAVFRQGEGILRKELSALSRDHLMSIITAYDLADREQLVGLSEGQLREFIVSAVRNAG